MAHMKVYMSFFVTLLIKMSRYSQVLHQLNITTVRNISAKNKNWKKCTAAVHADMKLWNPTPDTEPAGLTLHVVGEIQLLWANDLIHVASNTHSEHPSSKNNFAGFRLGGAGRHSLLLLYIL